MTARATRKLNNASQQFQEILLPSTTTTDATPVVIYTSNVDIPEGRVLEIMVYSLIYTPDVSVASALHSRGIYARATGGNLRLVENVKDDLIGEIKPNQAAIVFGISGQRFTISTRGKTATTYNWVVRIEAPRNA